MHLIESEYYKKSKLQGSNKIMLLMFMKGQNMLSDLVIGRAQHQKYVDLHRHAEWHCKPSLLRRLINYFQRQPGK